MLYTDYYNLFLGTVMNQNVQPILSQENIYNGKPRKIHLTIVKTINRIFDNDTNSSDDRDTNKTTPAYVSEVNVVHQVTFLLHTRMIF